jgi:hypothetical protein
MTDDVNDFLRFFCPRVAFSYYRLRIIRNAYSHSIVLGGLLEMS